MKLEDYKEQIDAYFDNVSPSEVIKRFEELGYEFIPIDTPEFEDLQYTFVKINDNYKGEDICNYATMLESKPELVGENIAAEPTPTYYSPPRYVVAA